jgi:hypothetical protein
MKVAEDARIEVDRMRSELQGKQAELNRLLMDKDRIRADIDRIRREAEEEALKVRRELYETKQSLSEVSKTKGVEIQSLVSKFETEKSEFHRLLEGKQQAYNELRYKFDEAQMHIQSLKMVFL